MSVVFSGSSGSSNNKTDHHDIAEILLKVALNTIKQAYIYKLCIIENKNITIYFIEKKYMYKDIL